MSVTRLTSSSWIWLSMSCGELLVATSFLFCLLILYLAGEDCVLLEVRLAVEAASRLLLFPGFSLPLFPEFEGLPPATALRSKSGEEAVAAAAADEAAAMAADTAAT